MAPSMRPTPRPTPEPIVLRPGEWVLTEHDGRFYAVGTVHLGPEEAHAHRPARCCENGHDNPDGVEECWTGVRELDEITRQEDR